MVSNGALTILTLISVIKVISCDAIPQAPPSAPALPNIPGLSSIVDDLMKVVEKAKSRWDALQHNYGSGGLSLSNLLFPNRKRGPSRADSMNKIASGGQPYPFQALLDNEVNSFAYPLPYQFQNEHPLRRSSQLNPVQTPTGAVYVPKNPTPSMKLIHRPAAPVSNCLYGKTGTLCQDLSTYPVVESQKDWEDLFSNIQLTEY